MGGFFGVASKEDCVFDLFFGTDYHSHLGIKSKMHPFEQNLIKRQIPCMAIWVSAVYQITRHSRF